MRTSLGWEGGRGGVLLAFVKEASERAQDERVVLLGPELSDIQDDGFPAALRVLIDKDSRLDFGYCRGREDDDGIFEGTARPCGAPDGPDMCLCPGRVAHDNVNMSSDPTVETGKCQPVLALDLALEPLARTRIDTF
jgi:hypothetical protein